jgi:3-methyladenine DNA glycosylase AlkC
MAPAEHALALPEPAQSVFTNYLNIQTTLAGDSFQGVRDSAAAILTSIRSDSAGTFSAAVAQAAEDLAKATDITVGRQVFKRLSDTLIKYLDAHKEHASHFVKAFCPMANAMWLQTGSVVNNPYLGKEMARCGNIQS